MGLEPPPVESCRVLEVGCNEGANLIPMAYAIPGGQFVGFDLASLPISRGQERIQALGMKNIRLFQADLMNVSSELGEFDYIIAHGLYAWIPEPVRDGLLALCERHLSPNGVAFISYNALPGGYLRMMTRDMMLVRTRGIADPERQVREGVDFIRLLAETRTEGSLYRALLEEQLKRLSKNNAHALYHDDFSAAYRPVYFAQFVDHAKKHGLQYLTDAELPPPNDPCFDANFQNSIRGATGGDLIAQEQMVDFARMRMFRETLLSRAE
jgi:SAM-dependent methyltransferase